MKRLNIGNPIGGASGFYVKLRAERKLGGRVEALTPHRHAVRRFMASIVGTKAVLPELLHDPQPRAA